MAKEGIRFITNANVGQDISAEELYKNNDAVLLCMGATRPRDLPIPGNVTRLSTIAEILKILIQNFY